MACMDSLDITTVVNLMYFYGKQRSGSKHFIESLIDAVSGTNPAQIQDIRILFQATIALNLISGLEHAETLHALAAETMNQCDQLSSDERLLLKDVFLTASEEGHA